MQWRTTHEMYENIKEEDKGLHDILLDIETDEDGKVKEKRTKGQNAFTLYTRDRGSSFPTDITILAETVEEAQEIYFDYCEEYGAYKGIFEVKRGTSWFEPKSLLSRKSK